MVIRIHWWSLFSMVFIYRVRFLFWIDSFYHLTYCGLGSLYSVLHLAMCVPVHYSWIQRGFGAKYVCSQEEAHGGGCGNSSSGTASFLTPLDATIVELVVVSMSFILLGDLDLLFFLLLGDLELFVLGGFVLLADLLLLADLKVFLLSRARSLSLAKRAILRAEWGLTLLARQDSRSARTTREWMNLLCQVMIAVWI